MDGGKGRTDLSGGNPGAGGRKRPAQSGEDECEEGEKPLTLSTLLAALKENREEIVAQVREDVDGLSCRVVAAEQTVAQHRRPDHVTPGSHDREALRDGAERQKGGGKTRVPPPALRAPRGQVRESRLPGLQHANL